MSPAYMAGLFDGEGCVLITRDHRASHPKSGPCYTLRCDIANTDRRPLDWLHQKFGGDIRRQTQGKKKPVYYWRSGAQIARRFLEWVRPWLIIKALQVDLALEFLANRILRSTGRGKHLTEEELALREGYYLALREAKRTVLS